MIAPHSKAEPLVSTAIAPALLAHLEAESKVPPADLARARAAASAADKRLDQALLDLGLVSEATLAELLQTHLGVAEIAAEQLPGAPVLSDLFKPSYLATNILIPIAADETSVSLAMVDPLDDFSVAAVAIKTGRRVQRWRISRPRFDAALEKIYGLGVATTDADRDGSEREASSGDVDVLKEAASDVPVVRFVSDAFRRAVELGASDIHLRPTRTGAQMLFRIDGELAEQPPPDSRAYPSIISRLKILASLDISERRLPQDGRIRANVGGRPIDIRISTMPHVNGEAAVLRLLSRELAVSGLSELGFSDAIEAGLSRLFGATDGLVLVTGPTGSGKSTTLHAALKQIVRPELNVVTVEDPVEYRVDGAAQIQVDEKIGLTFPRVLRSLLRQDPDIILIGEIRDPETAKIAVQAALTGHLVLATLHTNSALAAVPRLVDMGVEPYLLGAVLRGVLAQRLVRRRCPEHKSTATGTCLRCGGSGYVGRVAVGELVHLDSELTESLSRTLELTQAQQEHLRLGGFKPLREDAEMRAQNGEIDPAELRGLIDVA